MTSPVDVSKLEAALEKATPGPWGAYWGDQVGSQVEHLDGPAVRVKFNVAEMSDEYDREDENNQAEASADAELIALAVNHLPAFVALVRAVETLADEWDVVAMTEEAGNADAPHTSGGPWEDGYWVAQHHAATRLRAVVAAALNPTPRSEEETNR